MSLITCPECGATISEYAEFCVKCGCPKQKIQELIQCSEKERASSVSIQQDHLHNKSELREHSDEEKKDLRVEDGDIVMCIGIDNGIYGDFQVDLKRYEWQKDILGLGINEIFSNSNGDFKVVDIEKMVREDKPKEKNKRKPRDPYEGWENLAPKLAKDNYGAFGQRRKWDT